MAGDLVGVDDRVIVGKAGRAGGRPLGEALAVVLHR